MGLLTLAGTRLVTQFVAPEIYGAVNLVQNALLLVRALFCSAALNAGLRYYPDAERGGYVDGLRRMLAGTVGRALVAMEALTIVGGLIWSHEAAIRPSIVWILGVFVVVDVLLTLEMALFNAARRQRAAAVFGIIASLAKPAFIVGGVLVLGSTIPVVLGATAAAALATLLLLHATGDRRRSASRELPVPPAIKAEMWRFAVPLIPIALLNWTTSVSDRYIIEWISRDMSGLGAYAAGYGLISQPFLLIHGVVALTLRPVYFAAASRDDAAHAGRTFRAWIMTTATLCAVATVAIFSARFFIVGAFLGPKYRGAAQFVPWIALGYLFYSVEQVLEQKLLAYKRTSSVLVAQVCGAVASVAITIPCVARFGALGAAYACPIYFAIQTAVVAGLVRRTRA